MKEGKRLYELKRMHLLYKLEDMIPSGLQHRLLVILVNYELLMSHENRLILIYAYQTVPKALTFLGYFFIHVFLKSKPYHLRIIVLFISR